MRHSYETNLHFAIHAEYPGYVNASSPVASPRRAKIERLNKLYRYMRRLSATVSPRLGFFGCHPRRMGKKTRMKIINIFEQPSKIPLPSRRVYVGYPFVLHALRVIHNRRKHRWDLSEFINEYRALCDNEGIGPRLVVVEQKHQIEFQVYDQGPLAAPRIVTYTRS